MENNCLKFINFNLIEFMYKILRMFYSKLYVVCIECWDFERLCVADFTQHHIKHYHIHHK